MARTVAARRFLRFLPLALAAAVSGGAAPAEEGCPPAAAEATAVAEIVDGDTLRLADGRTVRIAGIEAPKATGAGGALAEAAGKELARLVGAGPVAVAPAGKADRYGRLHAAVTLGDGRDLAAAILGAGFARVRSFPGAEPCLSRLLAAETAARTAGAGLWADRNFAVRRAGDPSLAAQTGLYELVEGRVVSVGRGTRMIFLDFGRDYRRDFTIMVPNAVAARLVLPADGLDGLKGRRVRVRGVIEESGGPAIRLDDPAAIELLDEDDRDDGQG